MIIQPDTVFEESYKGLLLILLGKKYIECFYSMLRSTQLREQTNRQKNNINKTFALIICICFGIFNQLTFVKRYMSIFMSVTG